MAKCLSFPSFKTLKMFHKGHEEVSNGLAKLILLNRCGNRGKKKSQISASVKIKKDDSCLLYLSKKKKQKKITLTNLA